MKLLKWLISSIMIVILIVGGTILLINAKYGINVFDVAKSLGKIGQMPEISQVAPKAPTDADNTSAMNTINASIDGLIVYNSETQKYSLNNSVSSTMSSDIKLTGAQTCSLLNWVLDGQENMIANIGGRDVNLKEYEFTIVQIDFAEGEDGATNFNVVMSINLTKIKEKMTGLVLGWLKGKVPDKLYVLSTVAVTKNAGTFNYSVENVSLALNNMTGKEVEQAIKLLDIVVKSGNLTDFNKNLGKSFVDALIGNESVSGLTYSLKSVGVNDFAFEKVGETVYYVIKK